MKIWKSHPNYIEFAGPISDRKELARVYAKARGFVLFSIFESLSLSTLEAAAAGCPLLVTDLPWARTTLGENAAYFPAGATVEQAAGIIKDFSQNIAAQPKPPKPLRWMDVANQLVTIYAAVKARVG